MCLPQLSVWKTSYHLTPQISCSLWKSFELQMFLTRWRKHSYFRSKTKHKQIIYFGRKILHMSFKSCKLEQECICETWYHFHTRLISSPFENPQINMLTKKWYTLREYDAKHWIVTHWLILQSFQPSNLYWFVWFWPKNWSWPRLHKSDANYGIVRSWRFNERSLTFNFTQILMLLTKFVPLSTTNFAELHWEWPKLQSFQQHIGVIKLANLKTPTTE